MGALIGHLGKAVQHRLWGIEVGVALGQVDGSVLFADPGHPPDHGVGKQLYPLTELGHRDAPPYILVSWGNFADHTRLDKNKRHSKN